MAKITSDHPDLVDALRPLVGDVGTVRRVVIDIQAGHPPVVHVERIGDAGVIDVVRALEGVEISTVLTDEIAADTGESPNAKE